VEHPTPEVPIVSQDPAVSAKAAAEVAEAASGREAELDELRTALADRDAALAAGAESNRALLHRLRAALLASEPSVSPGLVTGETLDELEASFAAALDLVARIRDSVRQEAPAAIPAGAPGRTRPEPRNALEKIRSGLEQR